MKLQEIIEQDFTVRAWWIKIFRNERRVILKLSKKTSRGERFYAVHAPHACLSVRLSEIEFTAPVLMKTE